MLRLPCTSAIGDPEYAGLIVFLIQEERENNARVGPLHPERARQDHQNSNREQCLFDARTIQEMVPDIFSWPGIGLLWLTMMRKNGIEQG